LSKNGKSVLRKTTDPDPREEKNTKKNWWRIELHKFYQVFAWDLWFHPAPHTSIRIDHPHIDQELSQHLPT